MGGFYQNAGVPMGVYQMQKYHQLSWLHCGILPPLAYTWGPEHPPSAGEGHDEVSDQEQRI